MGMHGHIWARITQHNAGAMPQALDRESGALHCTTGSNIWCHAMRANPPHQRLVWAMVSLPPAGERAALGQWQKRWPFSAAEAMDRYHKPANHRMERERKRQPVMNINVVPPQTPHWCPTDLKQPPDLALIGPCPHWSPTDLKQPQTLPSLGAMPMVVVLLMSKKKATNLRQRER